jgi:hypothetical protein
MRLLLVCFSLYPLIIFSQDYVSYKVEPGEKLNEALPVTARYSYPDFMPGVVFFKDGVVSRANLNYSHLFGQLQFLKSRDTLYVSNVDDVKYVVVGNDTFYFQKYWLRQFACSGKVRLAEYKILDFANKEKIGPFGVKSLGAIEAVQSIDNVSSIDRNYTARETLIFVERNSYFFSDRFGNFIVANKKNLVDLFGKANPGLQKYLAEIKPNYNRREDMVALLNRLRVE